MNRETINEEDSRAGSIRAIDLFCGVGGLSYGLHTEGIDVVAGIDNDRSCKNSYEKNNDAKFIARDIARFSARELDALFGDTHTRLLVGCAPCQPYSTLARQNVSTQEAKKRWYPIYRFMKLVKAIRPEIVSMENVPDLANRNKYPVFKKFVDVLRSEGYSVYYEVVDASRYGVPQHRKRLVLLASLLGPIRLISETHSKDTVVTVRDVIGSLPPLVDGEKDQYDDLHRCSKLSDLNRKRISATPKNGGSATSWPIALKPACYLRPSGKSYMVTVYGRMSWDRPSPTITTQCTTLGTGRFGHPEQDRAISLREAARLQTFPDAYDFGLDHGMKVARHIGNAVPVELARAIARSIKNHVAEHTR